MDAKKAKKLLDEWQERLGLTDWNIMLRINLAPDSVGDEQGCAGHIEYSTTQRVARIEMIDEQYEDETWAYGLDLEKTLVHELLHPIIDPIVPDEYRGQAHQYIERLALALVSAKRHEPGKRKLTAPDIIDYKGGNY